MSHVRASMRTRLSVLVAAMFTVAAASAGAAPGNPTTPDDKQALQQLAANYLAQMATVDHLATAMTFGPMFQEAIQNPPTSEDMIAIVSWSQLPPMNPATAANAIASILPAPTVQDVAAFAVQRCGTQGLGQTLAALNTKLELGLPADVAPRFDAVRDRVCQLIQTAAAFKARYDKYVAITQNGITLLKRERHHKYEFAGHTRHVMGGLNVVWFPDFANTLSDTSSNTADSTFQYTNWMKYSDRDPTNLNLRQRLSDLRANQPPCKGLPFPLGEGLTLKLQVADANSSSATIEACLHFHFIGDSEDMGLGSMTIPAPFGYLAELESMKDGAKQNLANQIVGQIAGMFSDEQKGKINTLYSLIERLQSQ